jgi:Transmembrane protein 43
MRHQYTSTEHTSWLQQLRNSSGGAVIGIAFIAAALGTIHWNETRINMATLAERSVEVSRASQGSLVSVTGPISTNELLDDGQLLRPGRYIVIDRTVEMYSWKENSKTEERKKHLGGSETTTKYTYESQWTSDPKNSSQFKYSSEHHNPSKAIADQLFKVNTAQIGQYNLDMNYLSYVSNPRSNCTNQNQSSLWKKDSNNSMYRSIQLRPSDALVLNSKNAKQRLNNVITPSYVYQSRNASGSPKVGDLRICYAALPAGSLVTVFGKLDQSRITVYPKRGVEFLRLIPGNRSEALKILSSEERIWKWAFRCAGFGLMYIGVGLSGYPIVVLCNFFPWLGWIAEYLQKKLTFMLAFIATIATILLSF